MCRLYGHIAARPLPLSGMLLDQPHALVTQSCGDWRGERHRDGWGIGYFENGRPQVIRRPTAAPEDEEFTAAARRIESFVAVAGTSPGVGRRSVRGQRADPFTYGSWIFVHNGTVTGFDQLRRQLVDETDSDLQRHVLGTTDSEQVFVWLLSRLRRAGEAAEGPCGICNSWCANGLGDPCPRRADAATQPAEPTRLNFVLTDGVVLFASRWKHSLYWTNQAGPLATGKGGPSRSRRGRGVGIDWRRGVGRGAGRPNPGHRSGPARPLASDITGKPYRRSPRRASIKKRMKSGAQRAAPSDGC